MKMLQLFCLKITMDQLTELQLIKEAQTNIQAFAKLYDWYFAKILAYCINRTGNKEIAEDVTSQTFINAIATVKNFNFEKASRLGPLLYAIAHNAIVDYYRINNKSVSLESLPNLEQTTNEPENIEQELTISEMQKKIIEVLNCLNERYTQIISLKYYSEMTTIEIAEAMGVKTSQVPVILFRALEAFRKAFKEKYPETEIFYNV